MARLLRRHSQPVVVLRVGSIAVSGDIAHVFPREGVTLVPWTLHGIPNDGLAPSEADGTIVGSWSNSVLGIAPDAVSAVDVLGDLLSFSWLDDRPAR